jgi:hypothetical protein
VVVSTVTANWKIAEVLCAIMLRRTTLLHVVRQVSISDVYRILREIGRQLGWIRARLHARWCVYLEQRAGKVIEGASGVARISDGGILAPETLLATPLEGAGLDTSNGE